MLTQNFVVAILGFAIYGVFEAMWITSRRAVITDLAPVEARGQVLGTFSMMYGIALLFAPLVFGTVWMIAGAQAACIVSAAICLAAAIYLAVVGKESLCKPGSRTAG